MAHRRRGCFRRSPQSRDLSFVHDQRLNCRTSLADAISGQARSDDRGVGFPPDAVLLKIDRILADGRGGGNGRKELEANGA
jgi:hypothetical protein